MPEQRCADWLLRRADQLSGRAFPVTQQFVAAMLGLRRTTVSAAAARLQALELISPRYGQVAVRDHAGPERLAGSCYRLFRDQADALASAVRRSGPSGGG